MAFHLSRLRAARRLRSLHFVPGGSQKFLDKALASRADALIIDLEDSVLPAEKPAARAEVGKWMASTHWGDKTVCVRINPLDTQLWEEDVEMTMKAEKPDMLVVPKVSSRDDLEKLGEKLSKVEQKLGREVGATTVLPIVSEVPEAPLRANEIARHPRVEAITWGAEDLSAELGAKRRRDGAWSEFHPPVTAAIDFHPFHSFHLCLLPSRVAILNMSYMSAQYFQWGNHASSIHWAAHV